MSQKKKSTKSLDMELDAYMAEAKLNSGNSEVKSG